MQFDTDEPRPAAGLDPGSGAAAATRYTKASTLPAAKVARAEAGTRALPGPSRGDEELLSHFDVLSGKDVRGAPARRNSCPQIQGWR